MESGFHSVGGRSQPRGRFLRLLILVYGKSVLKQGYFPSLKDGDLYDVVQLAYALQYIKGILDHDDGVCEKDYLQLQVKRERVKHFVHDDETLEVMRTISVILGSRKHLLVQVLTEVLKIVARILLSYFIINDDPRAQDCHTY